MAPSSQEQQQHEEDMQRGSSSSLMTGLKLAAAAGFLLSALVTLSNNGGQSNHHGFAAAAEVADEHPEAQHHRRLQAVDGNTPSYMESLMKDLKERKKLFAETPPEEVKYWFEYTGPLQVRTFVGLSLHGSVCTALAHERHQRKLQPRGREETIKA